MKARNGYAAQHTPVRTLRDTEYEAVARITRRMIAADASNMNGFKELVAAVTENRKLWQIFSKDLASSGNKLPDHLKKNLFVLAKFTRSHSSLVLRRKASVRPLIEINTAIMRGLKSGAP